jgi:hypothetical protein
MQLRHALTAAISAVSLALLIASSRCARGVNSLAAPAAPQSTNAGSNRSGQGTVASASPRPTMSPKPSGTISATCGLHLAASDSGLRLVAAGGTRIKVSLAPEFVSYHWDTPNWHRPEPSSTSRAEIPIRRPPHPPDPDSPRRCSRRTFPVALPLGEARDPGSKSSEGGQPSAGRRIPPVTLNRTRSACRVSGVGRAMARSRSCRRRFRHVSPLVPARCRPTASPGRCGDVHRSTPRTTSNPAARTGCPSSSRPPATEGRRCGSARLAEDGRSSCPR